MAETLKRWRQEITSAALIALLEYSLGLIFSAFMAVIGSRILTLKVNSLAPFKWPLAVVFGSGGAWLFILLSKKYSQYRPSFPRLNVDFHIVKKEIYYELKDGGQIEYKKRVLLRALRDGLESYHDRYHWTGSGSIVMQSAIPDQEVAETFRRTVWQYYEIRFPIILAKDETIETEIIWHLNDSSQTSVPFVSAVIEEPTTLLSLTVKLPTNVGVHEVICEIASGIGARKPFKSHRQTLDREGKAAWPIEGPKLLYSYAMKWIPNRSGPKQ
jgi:hypothetical protein